MALALLAATAIAGTPIEEHFAGFEARLAQLERENGALKLQLAEMAGGRSRRSASVSPLGVTEAGGRQLGHASPSATCCRWTPDNTCGSIEAERYRKCTEVHEYLEEKTTTHEFENLEHANCLGADSSKWKASFNGHMSNVTLSKDGNAVSSFRTPLKVTHAEDCGNVAPALTLQMDTTVDGALTVGGINVGQELTWLATAGRAGLPPRAGLVFELLTGFPGTVANQAVTYNAADSSFAFGGGGYVQLVRPVDKDFTIFFEIKTTVNALCEENCCKDRATYDPPNVCRDSGNGKGGWWEGAGLVDSEKGGFHKDFGVAIAGGKIMFGVGNTAAAVTLVSSSSVNDGAWHTVRASRTVGGMMRLYIDGTLETWYLNAGQVGLLDATAHTLIGAQLGEDHVAGSPSFTAGKFFTGSLRSVRIYDFVK
jgi:hypothetical protein